jgi:hypothetical protein
LQDPRQAAAQHFVADPRVAMTALMPAKVLGLERQAAAPRNEN